MTNKAIWSTHLLHLTTVDRDVYLIFKRKRTNQTYRWIFGLNGDLMAIWSHNDVHTRITIVLIAKLMVAFIHNPTKAFSIRCFCLKPGRWNLGESTLFCEREKSCDGSNERNKHLEIKTYQFDWFCFVYHTHYNSQIDAFNYFIWIWMHESIHQTYWKEWKLKRRIFLSFLWTYIIFFWPLTFFLTCSYRRMNPFMINSHTIRTWIHFIP